MKKIILLTIALLALEAAPLARAWSYNDGDLLLIFRESGHNDVEFDLGNINNLNLLGKANGYTTTITGWNTSLVTSQFGSDLTGVSIILAGATSQAAATPTAWISSADPNPFAYNLNVNAWTSALHGTISSIGNRPVSPYNVPPAAVTPTNAYSINPSGGSQYQAASYDYIVTSGNSGNVGTWGGNSPFVTIPVQQTIPGTFDFWSIGNSSGAPDQLVGTFTITANGTLTFVAGPQPSAITSVSRSSNVSTVQFTTYVGRPYSIGYTNQLAGTGAWPVDPTTIVGDGKTDSITHTNNNPGVEFYQINTQ
jgi:hypothetical protein